MADKDSFVGGFTPMPSEEPQGQRAFGVNCLIMASTHTTVTGENSVALGCHHVTITGARVIAIGCRDTTVTDDDVLVIGNQIFSKVPEDGSLDPTVRIALATWLSTLELATIDEDWLSRILGGKNDV